MLLARTGRHRQRYEEKFRLVAGCIPYRLKENDEDVAGNLENRLEVLMVSSPNRHDLVFPKGGWEDDESVLQAACREAWEEAGVQGILDENELGVWEFRSKSKQESCSSEGSCRGYMFALKVTRELDSWPEQENRERRWVTVSEAFELCRYEWMRKALRVFLRVLSDDGQPQQDREEVPSAGPVAEVAEPSSILQQACFMKPSDQGLNLVVLG